MGVYAELDEEKVAQFAGADADNPVRYAWVGEYKTEVSDGPHATRAESPEIHAFVNPWLSGNNECNPITVSWENFKVWSRGSSQTLRDA